MKIQKKSAAGSGGGSPGAQGKAAALKPTNEARARAMLREGEQLKRVASVSNGIYWKGIALMALALFLLVKAFNLGVYLFVVALVILAYEFLTKANMMLALTGNRVIVRNGILMLEVLQMNLNRVESVEVMWPPVGRILGYGTVLITGTGSRVTAVPFIADAGAFRAELDQMLYDREEKNADTGK